MKKIVNVIVVIVFVGLPVLMYLVGGNKTFKETHTAQTTAKITSRGTGCGSANTVVKFTYTVNGKQFENWTCYSQSQIMEAKFSDGSEAKACYDPAKPEDASVVPIGYLCGISGK